MKIAVYGISCAGKDTFIDKFLSHFPQYCHKKGSEQLNIISNRIYCKNFQELDPELQRKTRTFFAEELQDQKNFIVDGHYCFPDSRGFKIVFTENDYNLYDIFLYLRVTPSVAKERFLVSQKNQKYRNLTEQQIKDWQLKEISELRDICFKSHKEFIVLDPDFDLDMKFLHEYMDCFPELTPMSIAQRIVFQIENMRSDSNNFKKIAIFDCDKTIIKEDSTIPFFEINNANPVILKTIFTDDIYSVYQFWRQKELYKNFKKHPKTSLFHANNIVIEKLKSLKTSGYHVFGLTSGIYKFWNQFNEEHHLFEMVIGNDLSQNSKNLISDFVKGYVVELLLLQNYEVFSSGDSMCDIYMLEMSSGYLWAPGKIRPAVQAYIDNHKNTSIQQFARNENQYKGIKGEY
jgi:phosphoserine phosphatase